MAIKPLQPLASWMIAKPATFGTELKQFEDEDSQQTGNTERISAARVVHDRV
jgi:hypothetical protein